MDIFSWEKLRGVRWFVPTDNGVLYLKYEVSYPEDISIEDSRQIKAEYDKLTDAEKSALRIQFFASGMAYYLEETGAIARNGGPYMTWLPAVQEELNMLFDRLAAAPAPEPAPEPAPTTDPTDTVSLSVSDPPPAP